MIIITMRYDISDHKFLLVLLNHFKRINSIRIEEKGSQIVNMCSDEWSIWTAFVLELDMVFYVWEVTYYHDPLEVYTSHINW